MGENQRRRKRSRLVQFASLDDLRPGPRVRCLRMPRVVRHPRFLFKFYPSHPSRSPRMGDGSAIPDALYPRHGAITTHFLPENRALPLATA